MKLFLEDKLPLLGSVAIVSLYKHDLLSDIQGLRGRTISEYVSQTRVGLFVTVSDTHTSAGSNVEASELAVLVDDGDEADVV